MTAMRACLALALAALPLAHARADQAGVAIVAAAEAAVRQRLTCCTDVVVKATSHPEDFQLPKGTPSYIVGDIVGPWPRARVSVDVRVNVGGKVVRTVPVAISVAAFSPSWVYDANHPSRIEAGQLNLVARSVDIATARGTPVSGPDALKGLRLRRPAHAGDVATIEDFEPMPDIDTRQHVRLLASYGAIRIDSAGVALRSGNRGDIVPVQVDGADGPVQATVVDKGVAQVVH